MEIISLELSGFKNYETKTQFNFKDIHNNLIFDMNGSEKTFFFEAILGTIFGFSGDEKLQFRGDPELNKTFTSLVILVLDQRTMIIERDFETDFVACLLSDTKTTRSIFQGKDIAESGYSRPYLQMLRSVFPIINKELFIEVCYDIASENKGNFSNLLDTLYSLLTPQFKFNQIKSLVNEGNHFERQCEQAQQDKDPLKNFECLHAAVSHMIQIKQVESKLSSDIKKIELVIERLKSRYELNTVAESRLDREFPTLKMFNPIQLRADVLLWKSLIEVREKDEEQLRAIALRREHIENILKHDLYEYTQLHPEFTKDVQRFRERSDQIRYAKKAYMQYKEQIDKMSLSLESGKNIWRITLAVVPLLVAIVSFLFLGPKWIFIIPETVILFLLIWVLSGVTSQKTRNRIYHYKEETHILEKRIRNAKQEMNHIKKKSHLFENPQYLDSHLSRLKKCKQYQRELKALEQEEKALLSTLNSGTQAAQIEHYQEQYGKVIDINRRDLEAYLDDYLNQKNEISNLQQDSSSFPAISELEKLAQAHHQGIRELQEARATMTRTLKIENSSTPLSEVLDKLDRKIKNVQLQQNMAKYPMLN